jgi:hypothetical protein
MTNFVWTKNNTAMTHLPEKFVITIGRQMGSGGRQLGHLLAEKLNINFYDKELLLEAAKESGLCTEFFERNDERRPRFISGQFSFSMGMNPMGWFDSASVISDDVLYRAQSEFIQHAADRGPCVIVGRTADYVLRKHPNVINIFVHAQLEDCVSRVVSRDPSKTRDEARAIVEKTNRLRSHYYNFYTDKRWGDATSYDLTLNMSSLSMDSAVDLVINYIKLRLSAE